MISGSNNCTFKGIFPSQVSVDWISLKEPNNMGQDMAIRK